MYWIIAIALFTVGIVVIGYLVGSGYRTYDEIRTSFRGELVYEGLPMTLLSLIVVAAVACLVWPFTLLLGGGYLAGQYLPRLKFEEEEED